MVICPNNDHQKSGLDCFAQDATELKKLCKNLSSTFLSNPVDWQQNRIPWHKTQNPAISSVADAGKITRCPWTPSQGKLGL